MRKFKVGDRVKINVTEDVCDIFINEEGEVIYVEKDGYKGELVYKLFVKGVTLWVKEDWISRVVSNMTDDEIYDMLKPKMEKMGIDYNGELFDEYMSIEDVKRLVATVYRSGYGRGQKGRPFIIGKKKKQGGHWVPCKHEEKLTPGTKLRKNAVQAKGLNYSIERIPIGTEVEVLNGNKDSYVSISCDSIWIGPVNGENGKNKKAYNQFANMSGFSAIYIDSATEYFDKWVEE